MEMEWAVAASEEGRTDYGGQSGPASGWTGKRRGNQQLPSQKSLSPLVSPQRRLFNWSELSFGRRLRALWLLRCPLRLPYRMTSPHIRCVKFQIAVGGGKCVCS